MHAGNKRGGDNRALAWAALASLSLHLVLVVGWPRMQERLRAPPSPPIVSRLVEPPAPPPPSAPALQPPVERPKPDPQPVETKPAAAAKPPAEKKQRAEKSLPAPLAQPAERAPEPQRPSKPKPSPVDSSPQPAPAAESSPPVAAVVPAPSTASGPPQPAPSQSVQPPAAQASVDAATIIAQYRLQVLSAARRLKNRYPDLARENNWSGSVVVGLAVGADGGTEVRLKSGTGHSPLDQQASEMFRQAARAVPVPPALQGRAFSVELKAVYGLVD